MIAVALAGCVGSVATTEVDAGRGGDGGPGHDAAPSDAGPLADAPPSDGGRTEPDAAAPPDGVPMFVAIGKFGRITTSCDDGRTWGFDRSDDDAASCVGIDCDHHPGSSTGLTWGDGWFFASFGWGDNPTRLMRSQDGVTWETVYDMRGFSFAGIAWAEDRLVAGDVTPRYSLDHGATYMTAEWPDYHVPDGAWPNSRAIGYAPYEGGRIALVAAEGGGAWSDTVVSSDHGLTYQHPTTFPSECLGHSPHLTFGDGVWLETWGTSGYVCRSTDGGDHWTAIQPDPAATGGNSGAIWTGTEFVYYVGTRGFRSADGSAWTSFDVSFEVGAVARDPGTGTYVAVDGGWGHWYDEQRLFRSADGVTWEELGASAFVHGHPITHILFGYGAASAACP
jgi:hypothetical protein